MTVKVDGINGLTFADNSTQNVTALNASNITSGTLGKPRLPTGSVLQVVQGTLAGGVATTSSSFVTTGLAATITPTASSSKILVLVNLSNNRTSGSNIGSYFTVYRGATNIAGSGSGNLQNLQNMYQVSAGEVQMPCAMTILDSPATTSATTYTVYFATEAGKGGTTNVNWNSQTSYIQLLEIAA